ncbi:MULTISPECIES: DUF6892 domain-containing protein [unclassified Rhizobium]|uniref:DUF7256 domain-containing protein n=1 Tax=unclassified Rhizobium TaxID=2613769 RepID=UPI001FEF9F0D|nr:MULTISPECIES: hypothetical protein [unclassified Rhizobium]
MRKREFLIGTAVLALSVVTGGEGMAASNEPVDASALATLRPGMPMSAVEKAMGSAWRTPAPHKGGVIDILENTHGVVVRIDRKGLIGRIDFNSRFMHTIAGIPMGISLADLRATVPDMEIGDESATSGGARFGTKQLLESILSARITFDKVSGIAIFNPKAEYAEPSAPPYPTGSGAPGAPFSDPNLKLAVMSSLLFAKALDLGTPQQLASHVLGRTVDLERDGYELIPEALDYLVRYPLTDENLAAVERIEFDGSGAIYPYAWYFWGGEEDVFDIKDISGLRFCPNLKSFSVNSMIDKVDIRALVPLRKLERVSINVPSEHVDALLDLPSLREAGRFPQSPAIDDTFEELERRGVQVY